ncbi:hypothetical protein H9Y04_11430 [Streptomyces sp. TRM66268-LWL]|uniref:DUF3592 domain-containing protein n=1 Tax=Streptomyces polyasparticus TaxID=2767826 RepID=A0ABR7SCH2_9ACTN|nr:hypothetical protein [Streptomyces polyasparticus]MBC9713182.1 hypothetical protein [Streptomyces polyasparticus]
MEYERGRQRGRDRAVESSRHAAGTRIRRSPAARIQRRLSRPALPPPLWLRIEGICVALIGTLAVIGCAVAAVLAGLPSSKALAAGAVAASALTLYLLVTRAGRLLTGAVAGLGIALAAVVPQLATELTLAERGERVQVVVTAVDASSEDGGRYLCSVRHGDGTPVQRRLWRGCSASVSPGESIAMVYDPKGRVEPRGITPEPVTWRLAAQSAGLAALLAAFGYTAVVRSIRRR